MKQSIISAVCVTVISLATLCGCATRNIVVVLNDDFTERKGVVLNDDFTEFDQNIWKEVEGSISVAGGVLTIDSGGNKKGYIRHRLSSSEWQFIELRARVDMVYGTFVGDILANPGAIYYNKRVGFCIWENCQMMIAPGDLQWHIWKIIQTYKGVDIYMDGVYLITNTQYDPTEVTLGNELADLDHGVRVSYDWIKIR